MEPLFTELPSDKIANLSLHEITQTYGTSGLVQRLNHESDNHFSHEDQLAIGQAFINAYALHQYDARSTEPYINHPLRVALRVIVHYGQHDTNLVNACLFHDCVEDHARELAPDLPPVTEELLVREAAKGMLALLSNEQVADLVSEVTNPIYDPNRDRHTQYYEHLERIANGPKTLPFLIKLSDLTDNACSAAKYSTGPILLKAAIKYPPALRICINALETRTDLPLEDAVVHDIHAKFGRAAYDLTKLRAA